MKIVRICDENKEVATLKNCTCVECKKSPAEVALIFGKGTMTSVNLCFECAWTLGDLLDETTAVDFREIDNKNKPKRLTVPRSMR